MAKENMISVIIPTYNRREKVARAIRSVLSQDLSSAVNIIVVDDGSSDGTLESLAQLAADGRVRIIRHEQNRGVCAAKNTGMRAVDTEWFTILDSDDEIVPHALQRMLSIAEKHGASAVTCNCLDSATGQWAGVAPQKEGWISLRDVSMMDGEQWGITKTSLLPTGALLDESLPGFEDTLWFRVNALARRYYITDALRIYHTDGEDRITSPARRRSLARKVAVFIRLAEHKEYLDIMRANFPSRFVVIYGKIVVAKILRLFGIGASVG